MLLPTVLPSAVWISIKEVTAGLKKQFSRFSVSQSQFSHDIALCSDSIFRSAIWDYITDWKEWGVKSVALTHRRMCKYYARQYRSKASSIPWQQGLMMGSAVASLAVISLFAVRFFSRFADPGIPTSFPLSELRPEPAIVPNFFVNITTGICQDGPKPLSLVPSIEKSVSRVLFSAVRSEAQAPILLLSGEGKGNGVGQLIVPRVVFARSESEEQCFCLSDSDQKGLQLSLMPKGIARIDPSCYLRFPILRFHEIRVLAGKEPWQTVALSPYLEPLFVIQSPISLGINLSYEIAINSFSEDRSLALVPYRKNRHDSFCIDNGFRMKELFRPIIRTLPAASLAFNSTQKR